jgi:hypothetical protein
MYYFAPRYQNNKKKTERETQTLACNGMSLDCFMNVNNSWGFSTERIGGIKTTGLRVYQFFRFLHSRARLC